MKRHALNHQAAAYALEFRRPVRLAHRPQLGEKRAGLRERWQEPFKLAAKADNGNRPGLVAEETHYFACAVDVLGGKRRHIRLSAAEVPAEFIKRAAFRVSFLRHDGLMFVPSDGALLLELHFRPALLCQNRPGQPIHVEGEVVNPPQEHVGCHGTGFQDFQEVRRVGFENRQVADDVKRLVLHRPFVANQRRAGFELGHLVHRDLPGALGNFGVRRGEICPRDLQIEDGLTVSFVLGMKERQRLGFVLCAKAVLFACLRVLAVVNARSPEQVTDIVLPKFLQLRNQKLPTSTSLDIQYAVTGASTGSWRPECCRQRTVDCWKRGREKNFRFL